MKKISFIILLFFLSFPFFSIEPTIEQKQAVFMMNYAQYVTYKLKTYNNILALEEEYENLKDNMNFETIKDFDSIETINTLMTSIKTERRNHKNRERLKIAVERKMNNALYNSIPTITTVVTGNMNPLSLAINAARTTAGLFVSYQQYKNQLSEEYDDKMFEFQTLKEDMLNEIYERLNTYTYKLMKKYNISDDWRLNETELKNIFKYIKDTNKQRAYTNLKNMSSERFVQHFPIFWYHLAKLAYDNGDEKAALSFFDRFESENIEIFRYDSTAVDAYKGKIAILLKDGANKFEIVSKLKFIEKNKTSWNDYYFCSLGYAQLGDKVNAKRLLERNINELSSEIENQFLHGAYLDKILNETQQTSSGFLSRATSFFSSDNSKSKAFEVAGSPEYDGLELCRALLTELGNEKIVMNSIESLYQSDIQSVNEIFYRFGMNPASYILNNSKEDIKKVLLTTKVFSEKTCQIDVKIPLQWMMSSNSTLFAVFWKEGIKEPKLIPLKIAESESKKLKKARATPKSTILYYSTGRVDIDWKKDNYSFGGILIEHQLYPINFEYSVDLNKPVKEIEPYAIYFNKTEYEL